MRRTLAALVVIATLLVTGGAASADGPTIRPMCTGSILTGC